MATAIIIAKQKQKVLNLFDDKRAVRINEALPFRVRFINIGITGYGPNNPAPIGIAVIGLNNYIL